MMVILNLYFAWKNRSWLIYLFLSNQFLFLDDFGMFLGLLYDLERFYGVYKVFWVKNRFRSKFST